jgi:hypothetical protein
MADVKEWADSMAGNGSGVPPDYPPEGMDKSDVNNCMREMMAAVRAWYQDQTFIDLFVSNDETWTVSRIDASTVRVAGPASAEAVFSDDRRVKITANSGPTTVYGFVDSVSYAVGNTDVVVTIDAAGSVPADTDQIEVMALELGRVVSRNVGSAADEVADGAALTASIAANVSAKSAAFKDYADTFGEADKVPLYDQLGTAAQLAFGVGTEDLVKASDIPSLLGTLALGDYAEMVFAEKTSDQTVDNLEHDITSMTGIALPGTPDGAKKYVLDAVVQFGPNATAAQVRVYLGGSGDKGDAEILDFPNNPASAALSVAGYEFTPGVLDTHIGFSFDHSTLGDQTVFGSGNVRSWLRVREAIE